MSEPTVVVVGAGMGGLACAIDLAARGRRVQVLERAPAPGGKARAIELGDDAIDGGPTVFTMPWVFEELFDRAGADFRAALPLQRATILARHTWPDGKEMDLFDDPARSADAIGEAFGAREAEAYRRFCEDAKTIYEVSEGPFLRSQRLGLTGIAKQFGARGLATLATLDSHRSMWNALRNRFDSPELCQLFGRYATYVGSSPFETPATLNLIAHVEAQGVYRARGGMRGLVRALVDLAGSLGVEIRHGVEVDRVVVRRGRATGVETAGGFVAADAVVFNGDVSALGSGRLGSAAAKGTAVTPRAARSLSAVTWAMRARASGPALTHHNVFFCEHYRAEFDALFDQRRVPTDPTVYVCAQDRADDGSDIDGEERLLVLINAPATGDEPARWTDAERERCTEAMRRVLRRAGQTLEATAIEQTTPADFARRFPATGGALYGPRWRGAMSVLSRTGAATKVPGLYLAGGSVHPGPGVPMAALSGRRAAERVHEDLPSTRRSRRGVTSGITSTV